MLGVSIYVEGQRLELFKDESIEINSSVQNINDISKTFSDFSQSFTVPASDANNAIFQHYYNTDVDGTFNPNIRVLGYIELGSLPYKYGLIQLEDVKLKNTKPYAYTVRFFSSVVNLSDLFKEDELSVLDLSDYNHSFDTSIFDATYSPSIANGDVYYPLITSMRNIEVGTGSSTDITDTTGELKYYELKPALRLNAIVEAIENHYNISFNGNFLNRAVFDNLFMWMHREAGQIEALGNEETVNITSAGSLAGVGVTTDTVNNTIAYSITSTYKNQVIFKVIPQAGFENIIYKARIYNNGIPVIEATGTGTKDFVFQATNIANYLLSFTVQSVGDFDFQTSIIVRRTRPSRLDGSTNTPVQSLDGLCTISDVIPKMKVKDFITSIIKMFNLVLVPVNSTSFTLIPLDDWYNEGKLVDISEYVDTKDFTIKRPKLFKQIDFKHQESGQILAERFRLNNGGIGYGDLRSTYDIDGTELKIETQFENLMFERLTDASTSDLTNIQVGKSLDNTLQPYVGKPFIFYRNGYAFYETPIKADGHSDLDYTWQTSTENDFFLNQVSNTVNYSADISTYLYAEITNNLFSNYWEDYISDLYSLKRRINNYVAYLPIGILIKVKLNDRLKIGNNAYIINTMKPNLTTGKVDFELLNYIGQPYNSINDNIMLTADTVDYTADTIELTADMISLYVPAYSAYANGVAFTELLVTPSAQNYDCKITANQSYTVSKVDTGDGDGWVSLENSSGISNSYLKILVSEYTAAITNDTLSRSMDLEVEIGADSFTITITQEQ